MSTSPQHGSPPEPPPLTPVGRAVRDGRLELLVGELRRHHRARRARRASVVAAVAAVGMAGAVALMLRPALVPGGDPGRTASGAVAEAAPGSAVGRDPLAPVVTVRTDPAILHRFRVAAPTRVEVIDDDELLITLAAMDRPAGLIRRGDQVWLTADVVDGPGLEPSPAPRGEG